MEAGVAGGAVSIAGASRHHEHQAGRGMWKKLLGHLGPTTKGASSRGEPRLPQK